MLLYQTEYLKFYTCEIDEEHYTRKHHHRGSEDTGKISRNHSSGESGKESRYYAKVTSSPGWKECDKHCTEDRKIVCLYERNVHLCYANCLKKVSVC